MLAYTANVGDPRAALDRIQFLFQMRYSELANTSELNDLVEGQGYVRRLSYFSLPVIGPVDGLYKTIRPRLYFNKDQNNDISVFIGGCEDVADGTQVWDGYIGFRTGNYTFSNSTFDLWGTNIANFLNNTNVLRNRWFICGYSSGGAVAVYVARVLVSLGIPAENISIIAFGSPKAVRNWSNVPVAPNKVCHWMNSDDAVPLIPPPISTFQRVMGGLSVADGQAIDGYQGFPGGVSLQITGEMVASVLPVGNPTPAVQAIGEWLANQEVGRVNPHFLSIYEARLRLAISLLPAGSTQNAPTAPPPTPEPPIRVRGIQAAQVVADQAAAEQGAQQGAQPVTIPEPEVFVARKQGRIWYVQFGGVTIAMAPHRRGARALARQGNQWLRTLQNKALVAAGPLAQQFAEYLAAASDPTSGFTPVMQTTF